MTELLLRAARHNAWANDLIIQTISTLPEQACDMEIISSFPSIRRTVLHIWGAEDIWLQRFEGLRKPVFKAMTFDGSMKDACDVWQSSSAALLRFVEQESDETITRIIRATNLKGEPTADPLDAALQHVFNHGTYHRGQLVTMLRQEGIQSIPQTDLIVFNRSVLANHARSVDS